MQRLFSPFNPSKASPDKAIPRKVSPFQASPRKVRDWTSKGKAAATLKGSHTSQGWTLTAGAGVSLPWGLQGWLLEDANWQGVYVYSWLMVIGNR